MRVDEGLEYPEALVSKIQDPESQNKIVESWMDGWKKWWELLKTVNQLDVDASPVRCPDLKGSEKMVERIMKAKEDQDSIGGNVVCVVRGCPIGLGEPCFDKLNAMLAHAMVF